MAVGMSRQELIDRWHKTLKELNCKFAPIQAPPGVDTKAMEGDPRVVRIPETDTSKYSAYSSRMDMVVGLMDLISMNNERVESDLRSAGILK